MLQYLKKISLIRWILYITLFFLLALAGCQGSIGVTTEMQKTKTIARTSTALTATLHLEDLTISPNPSPTN